MKLGTYVKIRKKNFDILNFIIIRAYLSDLYTEIIIPGGQLYGGYVK